MARFGWSIEKAQLFPRRNEVRSNGICWTVRSLSVISVGCQVWGEAWRKLEVKTVGVVPLNLVSAATVDVVRGNSGELLVSGGDPQIVINVAGKARGDQQGLLVFDFACDQPRKALLQVFWTNEAAEFFPVPASFTFVADQGQVVVPLDSAPRWVLGGQVSSLRIDLQDLTACKSWNISNAFLTQRLQTDRLRPLWAANR